MIHANVSGFVPCRRKSTRMGQDKAAVTLDGRTLLDHALAALREVCRDVSILGKRELYGTQAPVIEDIFECGLSAASMRALQLAYAVQFVIAVDTPFLAQKFLSYLAETAAASSAVVTTPEITTTPALCTVYTSTSSHR